MIIQTMRSRSSKTLYRTTPGISDSAFSGQDSTSRDAATINPATRQAAGRKTRAPSRFYGVHASNGNGSAASPSTSNGRKKRSSKKGKLWSPWKLILFSVMLGIAGSFYLTHVFETQRMLQEVQQLRREYERAHRLYTEARRDYDRMIGPSEVYRRAESLGMITGGAADPVIIIER